MTYLDDIQQWIKDHTGMAMAAETTEYQLRFELYREVVWPIEPCESCGTRLWWWASDHEYAAPGRFHEHRDEWVLRGSIGPHHTPERCRELRR